MRVDRMICWLALTLLAACAADAQSMKLLHSQRSLYREVLVYEDGSERCMCFTRSCRVGRQSCMDMKRPDHMVMNYPKMMLAALYVNPQPRSILIIGLGGGTIPRALSQLLPQSSIDVVEIDPAVTQVAKQYFLFATNERMRVTEADGRVFVKRAVREQRQYDFVMLDAFDHEYIPEHLLTQEFLREVKALLAPQGVLVANTFSSSRLYDHESATYATVFPRFYNLRRENRVIIAMNGELPPMAQLRATSLALDARLQPFGIRSERLLPMFSDKRDWNPKARVLTDQYSPANLLNLKGGGSDANGE